MKWFLKFVTWLLDLDSKRNIEETDEDWSNRQI